MYYYLYRITEVISLYLYNYYLLMCVHETAR
jgi:hypothetical protein